MNRKLFGTPLQVTPSCWKMADVSPVTTESMQERPIMPHVAAHFWSRKPCNEHPVGFSAKRDQTDRIALLAEHINSRASDRSHAQQQNRDTERHLRRLRKLENGETKTKHNRPKEGEEKKRSSPSSRNPLSATLPRFPLRRGPQRVDIINGCAVTCESRPKATFVSHCFFVCSFPFLASAFGSRRREREEKSPPFRRGQQAWRTQQQQRIS
jgi:hypothetical protein